MKHITYLAEKEITESFQEDVWKIRLKTKEIRKIIKIDSFLNLRLLFLYDNQITKIKRLDNLVNLQLIDLSKNQITKIEGLDLLVNLKDLNLSYNQITKIERLDNLVNLQNIYLSENKITKIEGLNNLVNLQRIYLSENQITKIERLNFFANLHNLFFCKNTITKIEGLDTLVNLKNLVLSDNKIKKIEGMDNLINLRQLYLSSNQITKIEGVFLIVNLKVLYLYNNLINKIEGLDQLSNLQLLNLSINKITKIEGLNLLVKLDVLLVYENKIIEINDPSEITSCINLTNLYYDVNIIVHPIITRFINSNKLKNNKLNIFNDSQNVHDNTINRNIIESVNRLLKDIPLTDVDQTELSIDPILTEQTKRLLLEYMNHQEYHSLLLLSFAELFGIVWQVIKKHPNSSTIKEVLNQEMNDSICKCFTGRMYRLVNVLNGFDERVIINISDSDAIANVIIMLQKKYTNILELKEAIHKELIECGYEDAVIKKWIDFVE